MTMNTYNSHIGVISVLNLRGAMITIKISCETNQDFQRGEISRKKNHWYIISALHIGATL